MSEARRGSHAAVQGGPDIADGSVRGQSTTRVLPQCHSSCIAGYDNQIGQAVDRKNKSEKVDTVA